MMPETTFSQPLVTICHGNQRVEEKHRHRSNPKKKAGEGLETKKNDQVSQAELGAKKN